MSNKICQEFEKAHGDDYKPKFKKLGVGLMGKIAGFLEYRELMVKVRYVSKDWILFTQKYLQFSDQDNLKIWQGETKYAKAAKLRICIDKMYWGEEVVPILWHPYYTNADEFSLFYESFQKDSYEHSSIRKEEIEAIASYFHIFFADLFKFGDLFAKTKKITIFWTSGYYINLPQRSLTHFKYITSCENIKCLEELVIPFD